LLKIHLGDQTDSKLLLGTYVTTSTPGVFDWQPGVLTQAVTQGRWVLVEDIDMAPVDVLAVLVPLLETRFLHVPSRGERHEAKPGFMIFATTTGNHIQMVGDNLWHKIQVPNMEQHQLLFLLKQRFPMISEHVPLLLDTFFNICGKLDSTSGIVSRISVRDLIKWCNRICTIYTTQCLQEEAGCIELFFLEGLDCFTSMFPPGAIRDSLERYFGQCFNISENRCDFLLLHRVPHSVKQDKSVNYGRVQLPCKSSEKDQFNFATTSLSVCYLEKLAVATFMNEPILLVGETGTGKTTIVQKLANQLGHKLVVINMSQQSDSADLLGGFKPVDALMLATPVKEKFERLFSKTFSVKQNGAFLESIAKVYKKQNYDQLIIGFKNAIKMAKTVKDKQKNSISSSTKKKKDIDNTVFIEWEDFEILVEKFKVQVQQVKSQFLFSFIEGTLVTALKNGYWILLDEINLATAETLECLSGLLQKSTGSIMLLERGDSVPISRHPDFKLFACMNPANDAGKRDLPRGIRSRFTEFWIDSPDSNKADLNLIIKNYLYKFIPPGNQGDELCDEIGTFYTGAKSLSSNGQLFDGADARVHVSLRTLTRALTYASTIAPIYGLRRALYEGCYMTFMTGLNLTCFGKMKSLIFENILKGVHTPTAFIHQIPHPPEEIDKYVLIDSFWIKRGHFDVPEGIENEFVLTPSVSNNLRNLARGCLSGKYPILIQGPTSAGKTSMIEFLAKRTGHRFIRINNHEHTDLQEYLGGYMTNNEGRLVFQEGVLVEALRKGYWIVLDELNLAPTDVLEALNRLLDDNRELFLAEKQEFIKPHPHFMLFATQNPAGQYGGRKTLSRAFRNRFLEMHFTEIPEHELETIIEKRCQIAPSYAKKMVLVYKQLCKSRDASKIFEGRQSFITLRDLFRWALRRAVGYEQLATDGYMLIAERVRKENDRIVIQKILEKEFKVNLNIDTLYAKLFDEIIESVNVSNKSAVLSRVVWTSQMKRLFVLIYKARIHSEPVLLIGETGCGKTTVCQVLGELFEQKLHIVNAHQNSETSDFLGSQRPCRRREEHEKQLLLELDQFLKSKDLSGVETMTSDQVNTFIENIKEKFKNSEEIAERLSSLLTKTKSLFEWYDGPLVQAMKNGDMFLLDEISLADDSVLERLNSVLEPSRQLTLIEKNSLDIEEIIADPGFQFFATMNPGGDYGKKELSPALRNRFTEIWVPQVSNVEDLLKIVENSLLPLEDALMWAGRIVDFLQWFASYLQKSIGSIISLRDILSWSAFMKAASSKIGLSSAFFHGGSMVLVDGIGVNPLYGAMHNPDETIEKSREKLIEISQLLENTIDNTRVEYSKDHFGISPFIIPLGANKSTRKNKFSFMAPSTLKNCLRVLRAVQLSKPVLLEGSPGAGKTSLITTIAEFSRNPLVRINLSEQTDLMDLFGSDLPVEGGEGGEFSWRDGPFLNAMQKGEWVLLDELNLASQQVLEGLNACLDHRASVYIPELDKHFSCHPDFRVFAAQNPQSQGGGRKGLPKSFVNRFTLVYVKELQREDLLAICSSIYPDIDPKIYTKMIEFNLAMKSNTMDKRTFGWSGSPWEFNLRDILRWLELWKSSKFKSHPYEYFRTLYYQRMRTKEDRTQVLNLFKQIFGCLPKNIKVPSYEISSSHLIIGSQIYKRLNHRGLQLHAVPIDGLQLLPGTLGVLESLLQCVESKTMALLVGPSGSGKSSLIRLLASLCGETLVEFSMNPGVDALEILGGFEQVDYERRKQQFLDYTEKSLESIRRNAFLNGDPSILDCINIIWNEAKRSSMDIFENAIFKLFAVIEQYLENSELSSLKDMFSQLQALHRDDIRGRFEWMDSTLVNALELGHWILIDNVNLCASSVLDRLNSLLEVGGVLNLSERGLVNGEIKCLKPHPNFRIFMAMDPRHGEISRAMRNRAIELYIDNERNCATPYSLDSMKLLTSHGLPGPFFSSKYKDHPSVSNLSSVALKLISEKFNNGEDMPNPFMFETNDLLLEVPTIWPDFISGSMLINNSLKAEILTRGSLLYFYLKNRSCKIFSEKCIGHSPEISKLIRAAAIQFTKTLSANNEEFFGAYIDFIVAEYPMKELNHIFRAIDHDRPALLKEINDQRRNILEKINLIDLVNVLVNVNLC
jgi:midasin